MRFALFAPYFLPPPAREAALRVVAASGEIPITSQHLCRGFLHGNEGHIWHHRPSFQPARPYPASRQAAGAEVSLSSSPVSWPAKQCCYLLRPSPGESLAPFGGLGALARRLFLSARMRCSSESLIFNFQGAGGEHLLRCDIIVSTYDRKLHEKVILIENGKDHF